MEFIRNLLKDNLKDNFNKYFEYYKNEIYTDLSKENLKIFVDYVINKTISNIISDRPNNQHFNLNQNRKEAKDLYYNDLSNYTLILLILAIEEEQEKI